MRIRLLSCHELDSRIAESRIAQPARVRKVLHIFLHDDLLKSFLDYDSYAEFANTLLQSENQVALASFYDMPGVREKVRM